MLNIETARKIGIKACIDKLGHDFVMAHKDSATTAYGENDDGVFCFVGVDDCYKQSSQRGKLVLDSESKFPYRVSCNVNLVSGIPTFIESILPNIR